MKVSFKRKIIVYFPAFILISLIVLILSYNSHYAVNEKLRFIERVDILFNTVLEARRYEKNYLLSFKKQYLEKAISYASDAENELVNILEIEDKYALTTDLEMILLGLSQYKNNLIALQKLYVTGASSELTIEPLLLIREYHETIKEVGREITVDLEKIVKQDHNHGRELIEESKFYHLMALVAIIILCSLTALFLIINVNRPLKSIQAAVDKIAKGDYRTIPTITTGDEFESLVNSLNMMITEMNRRSEQLHQAAKLASLGTLTSGVAHELNNPLNNISTSVQILLEEMDQGDPEHKKNLLLDTETQVERARDTVKALLEFSRRKTFNLELVNFNDLVDNTVKLIKGEMPTGVNLSVAVPEDLQVNIDANRIQQVLINLIINSVQAMEEGGQLNIRASRLDAENMFFFQVEDTGEGIPEEDLPKIFDPFFTTKDINVGTGLGLSTSHGIVEQHGGRIEVTSTPGKGTVFNVYLPV